mgnify:CR=1 FL=1
MAALRGPDSSEDERRLGEQAVFPETVDVNIRQLDPIPAPRAFLREQPLTDEMSELVLHSRQEIRDVLNGRDDRLLVIVGPCSIHDPKAAHEYAEKLAAVKRANKVNFANYLEKATGQVIDPDSIFDCQVKRMHEYKRQHLNAMNIAAEYLYLKANPNADFVPKTYIFGAKAAPGYYMAKQMIRMICKLGKLIDNDPAVKDKLRIVYLEDYCVSLSERLMPASEVSEQISLAGTEASGTGNMKFMLNGAITLGTLDGANVEIADAAGKDNEIIFGMLTPEVNALKGMGYHPQAFISDDNVAMAVLDMLEKGWNGENFSEITNNLRNSDPYMVLADFKDSRRAQHTVQELYKQKQTWNRMSLMNISNAGIFSADRSIMDYARDIWGATPVK